jgi:hypothetical protein
MHAYIIQARYIPTSVFVFTEDIKKEIPVTGRGGP